MLRLSDVAIFAVACRSTFRSACWPDGHQPGTCLNIGPARAKVKVQNEKMAENSKFHGKWTRFVGCGTNGGTVTNVSFHEDMSCDLESVFQPGAGKRSSSNSEEAVMKSGNWKIVGEEIIFTPNDAGEPVSWNIEDSFGGRYGFRRLT